MPVVPFGQWRPDVSDYEGEHSRNILNVVPRGDGYGPFTDFAALTSALAAQCRGAFYARNSDGTVSVFAATSDRLYLLDNSTLAFADVSASGAAYTAIPTADQWWFRQFGSYVIAGQVNVAPQIFTLGSSTEFAALSGSPPQARYGTVVGRHLVLSGLSSNPFAIQWSGFNSVTTWDGTNQSDTQTFPDGGFVRGVAGGEYGLIVQDSAIRRMTYQGGDLVFAIERISDERGILGPRSLVQAGDRVFFYSTQGFVMVPTSGYPEPIGKERVDRTFAAELDTVNLQLFMGAPDPRQSRVYWAYKSTGGTANQFDKIIGYDWALDRWFPIRMSGEVLIPISQPGVTLENLDTISSSVDAMTGSFDDISTASLPSLAAFNSSHRLGTFSGSTLEATMESAEHGGNGKRIFVNGFRPVTDATTTYGSVSGRETSQATPVFGSETLVNAVGVCPQRVATRYARGKVRIPAGQSWTYAIGIEPDVTPLGGR